VVPSPKVVPLVLTDDERLTLTAWSRRRKTAQALALRSRIILTCAEGGTIGSVASELGAEHPHTLTSRSNLAHVLGDLGRLEEAEAVKNRK
jgi:hypothetical protein